MSDVKTAIMDAAERRMQLGGFGGFSFREIAADVGIKSSSVHYHFPTKEDLAAAVIRRWAEETSKFIDEELEKDPDPVRVWTKAFRGTAVSEGRMCPCTVLGAASQDLPPEVASGSEGLFQDVPGQARCGRALGKQRGRSVVDHHGRPGRCQCPRRYCRI